MFVSFDESGSGLMAYSADGISWTIQTVPAMVNMLMTGVVFGGGVWVAVGNDSNTSQDVRFTSPEGITWTKQMSSVETWPQQENVHVAFDGTPAEHWKLTITSARARSR